MDRSLFGERKVNVRFLQNEGKQCATCVIPSKKSVNKGQIPAVLEQYLSQLQCDAGGSVEDQWWILRYCIMTSAEEVTGRVKKKQPDWFINATEVLACLFG